MLEFQVMESEVNIKLGGNLTKENTKDFLERHKNETKSIKKSKYNLVIETDSFSVESNDLMKNVCMSFYKAGYRKIYIIDKNDFIMNNMKLSNFERKMFLKVVKLVKSRDDIKK
ncbi:MAG: hypothetical protein R3Y64_02250 [Peptostreptococcaceae bacterium]